MGKAQRDTDTVCPLKGFRSSWGDEACEDKFKCMLTIRKEEASRIRLDTSFKSVVIFLHTKSAHTTDYHLD